MSPEARASSLASVLEPGELVASSLLVALHLGHRREMLRAFLDALGLAHEDGILADEGGADAGPVATEKLAQARAGLLGTWNEHEVETYLNTLWLQDPERWQGLEGL
jgi:hypothetical protein